MAYPPYSSLLQRLTGEMGTKALSGSGKSAGQGGILVRGDSLKATMFANLIDQIHGTENIAVLGNTEVTVALFIFIGAVPATGIVGDLVARDKAGFLYTGPDLKQDGQRPKGWRLNRDPFLLETGVPGIFAAGDVRHGVIRRVASAVGQGGRGGEFDSQVFGEGLSCRVLRKGRGPAKLFPLRRRS